MKKLLITLIGIALAATTHAQTDPDFFKYKKQADDCFAKKDYACAEKNYKVALAVKPDDGYCKTKLNEVVSAKRKAEQRRRAEEQRRIEEEQETQRQEEELREQERRKKAERDEQVRVIYEVRKAIEKFDTIRTEYKILGEIKPELKKQKWLIDTLLKYQSKSYFWPEAYLTLGLIYWNGYIPRETLSLEPLEYFKKALPLPRAYSFLGLAYEIGRWVSKDNQKASEYYLAGAQQGNTTCMRNYADLKLKGNGITQNIQESLYWFQQSAEKGDTFAMQELGHLFYSGEYIAKDYVKAFVWFDKSNSQYSSQSFLAKMYFYGQGTEINYKMAFQYANLTSSDSDSKLILAIVLYKDNLSEFRKFDSFFEKMKVIEKYLQESKAEGNETAKKYELFYGNVIDLKTEKPVRGGTVEVKGTGTGTTTNADGEFCVLVYNKPPSSSILDGTYHSSNYYRILRFSNTFYQAQEIIYGLKPNGLHVKLFKK